VKLALIATFCVVCSGAADVLFAQEPDTTGVVVDFQDADIRFVISALAEAAQLNIVYGELLPRRITVRLGQPILRQDILPLLRGIAEANELEVVEEPGFIRFEQSNEVSARTESIDTGAGSGTGVRFFVHRLQHAQAARLAATLQDLFGRMTTPDQGDTRAATLSQSLRGQRIRLPLPDEEGPTPAGRSSEGTGAGTSLQEGLRADLRGPVRIVPDELTNSLLVRAEASDWEVIRQAITALDLRPLQVLIEALIVEVRRTEAFDLSVQIRGSDRGRDPVDPGLIGELEGQTFGGLELEIVRVGDLDLNVVLNALSTRGNVRIISRPVITAQNNQEARILIGAERPFIQVFRTLPTDNGVRDQIIQYRDVGTSLTVRPTINPDGYVNLQIAQEVSTATSEQQFGAPVISTREASTLLYVKDGQTAVIGGLIDHQQERTRAGIPILKDIPVLGALFGSTRRVDLNTELFLFLTPHVITTDDDLDHARDAVQQGTRRLPDPLPRLPVSPPEERGDTSAETSKGHRH
jgi:type II secretion system protein D